VLPDDSVFTPKHVGAFYCQFNAKLKLFLRLSNCASFGEKTLVIMKMHGVYVKI
jgi:hypothetical protein